MVAQLSQHTQFWQDLLRSQFSLHPTIIGVTSCNSCCGLEDSIGSCPLSESSRNASLSREPRDTQVIEVDGINFHTVVALAGALLPSARDGLNLRCGLFLLKDSSFSISGPCFSIDSIYGARIYSIDIDSISSKSIRKVSIRVAGSISSASGINVIDSISSKSIRKVSIRVASGIRVPAVSATGISH